MKEEKDDENKNIHVEKLLQNEQRDQDYKLKQNDNINEESTKRKPFDKIIFK